MTTNEVLTFLKCKLFLHLFEFNSFGSFWFQEATLCGALDFFDLFYPWNVSINPLTICKNLFVTLYTMGEFRKGKETFRLNSFCIVDGRLFRCFDGQINLNFSVSLKKPKTYNFVFRKVFTVEAITWYHYLTTTTHTHTRAL